MENLGNLVEKWHNSGLLEGLPEHRKIIFSIFLEKTLKHLLSNSSERDNNILPLVFPLMRRLYNENKIICPIFQISDFINQVRVEYQKFHLEFPSENFYTILDQEATFCAQFDYDYKNNSRLFIEFC